MAGYRAAVAGGVEFEVLSGVFGLLLSGVRGVELGHRRNWGGGRVGRELGVGGRWFSAGDVGLVEEERMQILRR